MQQPRSISTVLAAALLVVVLLGSSVSADKHKKETGSGGAREANTTYPSFAAAIAAANTTNSTLTTLFAAVQAAGVASLLNASTPYTVFAPTNAAFTSRLREDLNITPAALLLPANNATLLKVLSYHVIPGVVANASSLTNGQNLATALVGAAPLTVRLQAGKKPRIVGATNAATVEIADIRVARSIIHIVNDVLLPRGVGKGSGKSGGVKENA